MDIDWKMKCYNKEPYDFYRVIPENAKIVLDAIGFGENKCKETYSKDKRYGKITANAIEYGFEGSMSDKFYYGDCIVFDYYDNRWKIYSHSEFNEQFITEEDLARMIGKE